MCGSAAAAASKGIRPLAFKGAFRFSKMIAFLKGEHGSVCLSFRHSVSFSAKIRLANHVAFFILYLYAYIHTFYAPILMFICLSRKR